MMSGAMHQAEYRSLGNGRHSPPSPLKLFGQAKKKINDEFVKIGDYVNEVYQFLEATEVEDDIVTRESLEKVEGYIQKVRGIQEMLKRDRMKVAFFGRTSNGKSTVINAMLKRKILPSGIGHTTNCFLQVEGIDSEHGYVLKEDSDVRMGVDTVNQLANALSEFKLDPSARIRICWPKEKCSLLKDDVVLVDSPGIDVSPDLDSWIDDHCLDADVFVLVANAESTLMQTEKNFFHKVGEKLSKPNIFILNNRWDASAIEPEMMGDVRAQHLERNIAFLADELKVVDHHEAANRVFFVSARETLVSRSNQEKGTPTPTGTLLEGFQGRMFEFCNFERKFEECISQSAVQTKFAQHTDNGKLITSQLRNTMEEVLEKSNEKGSNCKQDLTETRDKLDYIENQLQLLTSEIKDKIKQMTEEVERKVSSALTEEIRRLAVLVDEFDRPFHPDDMVLNVYKKEIHIYLEEEIGRNLQARCTGFIHQVLDATNHDIQVTFNGSATGTWSAIFYSAQNVENVIKKELHAHIEAGVGRNVQNKCSTMLQQAVHTTQAMMTERMTSLLPQEAQQQAVNFLPTGDFEVAYRLDCRNLCAGFQENIQFHFSLGITSLVNRFMGKKGTKHILMGYSDTVPRPIPTTPQTPSNEGFGPASEQESEMMLALLGTFTSLYSRTTVGALAITGLVAKAAGWRVIAICGAIYGLLYVYERLTWTNKAKERAFKRQYVDYASSKLRLIVDLTSSNCSHQVQQELSSTFARLCRHIDLAKDELNSDMERLQVDIGKLEEVSSRCSKLKNEAVYLDSELNTFIRQYLKPESQL